MLRHADDVMDIYSDTTSISFFFSFIILQWSNINVFHVSHEQSVHFNSMFQSLRSRFARRKRETLLWVYGPQGFKCSSSRQSRLKSYKCTQTAIEQIFSKNNWNWSQSFYNVAIKLLVRFDKSLWDFFNCQLSVVL